MAYRPRIFPLTELTDRIDNTDGLRQSAETVDVHVFTGGQHHAEGNVRPHDDEDLHVCAHAGKRVDEADVLRHAHELFIRRLGPDGLEMGRGRPGARFCWNYDIPFTGHEPFTQKSSSKYVKRSPTARPDAARATRRGGWESK